MFNETFDWILAAILGFCGIALVLGKGDFILTSFRSKAERGKPLAYEKRKFSLTMGILCLIMLCAELVFIFLADVMPVLIFVSMGVVIVAFIAAMWYLRKYARNEDSEK